MYAKCLIEWEDNKEQQEVIIKTDNTMLEEEEGDKIFLYGLSINNINKSIENGSLCRNAWRILKINGIYENFKELDNEIVLGKKRKSEYLSDMASNIVSDMVNIYRERNNTPNFGGTYFDRVFLAGLYYDRYRMFIDETAKLKDFINIITEEIKKDNRVKKVTKTTTEIRIIIKDEYKTLKK